MSWIFFAALIAVPGPDSVVVVGSLADRESVALAERYARARQLPDKQVCLIEAPLTEDVDISVFEADIKGGIARCMQTRGITDRIEAFVLTRGLPLRIVIPTTNGPVRASMAAALALGETTTATGAPILGRPPGLRMNCGGTPCDAAHWSNPFRRGVFDASWTTTNTQAIWHPKIVTMLHGRSAADAAKLIASATTAEAMGGARGSFTFMNGADPARGALDAQAIGAMSQLSALGFTDVERVPFDSERVGHTYAAFFTGTAGIGQSIEGNTFLPGSLVDNLTSFGALPENFRETGEIQVSIARWVAMGVAGVHGTTDEPLNNCFPNRSLIGSYAQGGTLGEAYFRALPFAYWHNLVLGDPMAAPYAHRPRVTIAGAREGDSIDGSRHLTITATAALAIDSLVLYVDGVEIARSNGEPIDVCAQIQAAPGQQILAVAQVADLGTSESQHRPKGWSSIRVTGRPGPNDCMMPDAGEIDAGFEDDAKGTPGTPILMQGDGNFRFEFPDAAEPVMPASGCGCTTSGSSDAPALLFFFALLAAIRRERRSRVHRL